MAIRESLVVIKPCSAPQWGGFTSCATALSLGVVALFFNGESKAMTQSELNHQIAKRTGESVTEIARHGFTILAELPEDSDDDSQPPKGGARKAGA